MSSGRCLKCGIPMYVIRTDGLQFCAECERKICSEIHRLTKIDKVILKSESHDTEQ